MHDLDQIPDFENELGKLAHDERDVTFLDAFAFTQTFSFLLQQYLMNAQKDEMEAESEEKNSQ